MRPARPSRRGRQNRADERARREELSPRGQPSRAMPAADAVTREQLPSAGPRQRQDVLEVRRGGGDGADRGGAERAAGERDEEEQDGAARDLERPRRDVVVRHPVPERVQRRAGDGCAPAGAECRTGSGAGRDVQGDDQDLAGEATKTQPAGLPPMPQCFGDTP